MNQRRYEALRAYFTEGLTYEQAGARFGYTRWAMIDLVRQHRAGKLELFAPPRKPGPPPGTAPAKDRARGRAIELRRQGLSAYEISRRLGAEGTPLNRTSVGEILAEEGFGRLLRRPEPEASISPATAGRDTNLPAAKVIDFSAWPGRLEHFGVLFPHRMSHFDLTSIPQRWLRDLTWDYLADLLRSPRCPRSGGPFDGYRRAALELGVFLELEAPGGGHDPAVLRGEHAQRFVADQRHREREGLESLAVKRPGGAAGIVTTTTRSVVFNAIRKLLRDALDTGVADQLGLDREFITALPTAGATTGRTARRPFPDEVAQALAAEANLAELAATYDLNDNGARDIWETTVTTGRRIGEVIKVRWDCIGRYGGLAMFWHDQTKVGNYDAAIRIPERLYEVLAGRQRKTLDRFTARYGYRPAGAQRAQLALFPTIYRSHDGTVSLTHQWFYSRFRPWVDAMDLGHFVPHQARHTLATNLLRHGATLTHIRRYLGQVSDRMAEHYVHLSHSDLENVLQHVWVSGPGTANPGELLAGTAAPLSQAEAQALAVDLSRRSTPAEGGFCTFQPVVDGGACPWNLNCHSCDRFVLSGADLLYWRRKREQWRLLAEGAPDDATASYLHDYFEPTARAIDGLEKALAGLGLLDDALALDLRKPQDYFQRVWKTAFLASDLAKAGSSQDDDTLRAEHGDPAEMNA